ncbi:MAG: hypothetical protein JSU77_07175 [Fidelibacterota bacterium]|nr:MAG: hypothetical protein JSU77_07175 [Candidatus Neomarinimicrobiota bacterium]
MLDLVPIVALLSTFGAAGVILVFLIVYNYRKRQLQGQEILAAIEKGIDIPFPPPKKRNYLNLGLVWTFVGVAFTLALWFSARIMEAAAWGFLPIALGLAFLLIALIEGKKKANEGEEA